MPDRASMHKSGASMPPKHVKPTQLRRHGLQLLEIGGFWTLHDYQTGLKDVAKDGIGAVCRLQPVQVEKRGGISPSHLASRARV
uniref:Uncharacterized protein n=1 Tax=mine drainage metagenome TaxID=410659 RepID=E6PPZ7_9ZZZZ